MGELRIPDPAQRSRLTNNPKYTPGILTDLGQIYDGRMTTLGDREGHMVKSPDGLVMASKLKGYPGFEPDREPYWNVDVVISHLEPSSPGPAYWTAIQAYREKAGLRREQELIQDFLYMETSDDVIREWEIRQQLKVGTIAIEASEYDKAINNLGEKPRPGTRAYVNYLRRKQALDKELNAFREGNQRIPIDEAGVTELVASGYTDADVANREYELNQRIYSGESIDPDEMQLGIDRVTAELTGRGHDSEALGYEDEEVQRLLNQFEDSYLETNDGVPFERPMASVYYANTTRLGLRGAVEAITRNYTGMNDIHQDSHPEASVANALGASSLDIFYDTWTVAMAKETPVDAARFILRHLA